MCIRDSMDPERYCPIPVGITREGAWYVYTGPLDAIPGGRWQREAACVPCTLRLDRGNRALVLLDGSGREAVSYTHLVGYTIE